MYEVARGIKIYGLNKSVEKLRNVLVNKFTESEWGNRRSQQRKTTNYVFTIISNGNTHTNFSLISLNISLV